MNFFFDANMSRRYARMLFELHEGHHEIVHITDHPDFKSNNIFSENGTLIGNRTEDVEWIGRLGRCGTDWKLVSGESDIIDTAHERAALIESRLTFFSLDHRWNHSTFPEQAWKLVRIWDQIVKCAQATEPTLFRVHMGRQQSVEVIKTGKRARGGKFRG